MERINPIIDFCKDVLLLTGSQLIAVFGVFFFFGLLLYLFARFTRTAYVKSIGQSFDIYFTGWIGTPIHELGHAVFCILFGHKITEIKLFSPNISNGSLGYVNHAYNARNPYHRIGNFFIGFGPILFGSVVLYFLMRFLVPDNNAILSFVDKQSADFSSWEGFRHVLLQLWPNAKTLCSLIFSSDNLHSWQFYVFIYIAISISSHMELSPSDLKGLGSGLIYLILVVLVVNIILSLFGVESQRVVSFIVKYSSISTGILLFSTILSALFFIVSFILLNFYTLIRYKKTFQPFA